MADLYKKTSFSNERQLNNRRSGYSIKAEEEQEQIQSDIEKEEQRNAARNATASKVKYQDFFDTKTEHNDKTIERADKKIQDINYQIEYLNRDPEKNATEIARLQEKKYNLETKKLRAEESQMNNHNFGSTDYRNGHNLTLNEKKNNWEYRENIAKDGKDICINRNNELTNKNRANSDKISRNKNRLKELEGTSDKNLLAERDRLIRENNKLTKEINKNNKSIDKNTKKLNEFAKAEAKATQNIERINTKITNRKNFVNNVKGKISGGFDKSKNTFANSKVGGKVINSKTYQGFKKGVNKVSKAAKATKKAVNKAKDMMKAAGEAMSKVMSQAKQAIKQAAKSVGKALLKAILEILKTVGIFLISNPIGWIIDVILAVIAAIILVSILNVNLAAKDYLDNEPPAEDAYVFNRDDLYRAEYRAWVKAFKDDADDGSEPFYDEFHALVSADKIAVVSYIFKNETSYAKIQGDIAQEDIISTGKFDMDSYNETYLKVVKQYMDENNVDKTTLRKLYLDYIDYNFQYLIRTYTNWTKSHLPSQWIDESELESYQEKLTNEAYQHDEVIPYTATISVRYTHTKDHYKYECEDVCEIVNKKKVCTESCEYVYDYTETWHTYENKEITAYKFRDIDRGLDTWVSDTSGYQPISETVSTGIEHPRDTLNTDNFVPGVPAELKDWQKIYISDDNSRIVKRTKFWQLKKWDDNDTESHEDVKDLIIYEYNPTQNYSKTQEYTYSTVNVTTSGDTMTFTVTSKLDANDNKTFTVDKKQIYTNYYQSPTPKNWDLSKFFDETNVLSWDNKLTCYQVIFSAYAGSIGYQFAEGKIFMYPFLTDCPDDEELAKSKITQTFDGHFSSSFGEAEHHAYDFSWYIGASINSICDGTIISITDSFNDYPAGVSGTAGDMNRVNSIKVMTNPIEDVSGESHVFIIWYLHIAQNSVSSLGLTVGDSVQTGQIIAAQGHNGWSTGTHLHLEVFEGEAGAGKQLDFIDSMQFTAEGLSEAE